MFREEGRYRIEAVMKGAFSHPFTVRVREGEGAGERLARELMDHEEVRKVMILHGGFHLKEALGRLENISRLDVGMYSSLAKYVLGLAYARSGGKICLGAAEPGNLDLGAALLEEAYGEMEHPYWQKMISWWLTLCACHRGNRQTAEMYRRQFESISYPFARQARKQITRAFQTYCRR